MPATSLLISPVAIIPVVAMLLGVAVVSSAPRGCRQIPNRPLKVPGGLPHGIERRGTTLASDDPGGGDPRLHELQAGADSVFHALGGPLTAVVGYSDRLLAAAKSGAWDVGAQRIEELTTLSQEAHRLREIILLAQDAIEVEGGEFSIESEPVHLGRVVQSEISRIQRGHVDVVIEFASDDSVVVESDEGIVRRIVGHLLTNAVRHGQSPVEVTLKGSDDGGARLGITDHGAGIPAEVQSRVFDRFYRHPSASLLRGTGLGLYVSAQMAKRLGGRLELTSTSDSGTTFTLALPAESPPGVNGQP
ncbi:MAG: HAMP domain-containing histidine kinase [Dehalococcoidia bacterium]|nr:MAG: HAMP domain-containing histidine kinase [Dehalococcoidia bacterium]